MAALKSRFISHGTLGSKDLERTREFYQQFLGLEVVRTSPVSLMVRLGGAHVYAVVLTKNKERMPRCYHNGIDVANEAEVDEAWRLCQAQASQWGLHDITKPLERSTRFMSSRAVPVFKAERRGVARRASFCFCSC